MLIVEDATGIKAIYSRVATKYAEKIQQVFETEETMKVYFLKTFEYLEFTRTDHWRGLLGKLLTDVWFQYGPEVKAVPTGYDQEKILDILHHHLDFNLFTQVMLNLQRYVGFAYNIKEAQKDMESIKVYYKDKENSPFEPNAKMIKHASKFDDLRYNNDLSAMRALRIISKFGMVNSYRVSPKGSTPAFADSLNVSMIGAGGDKYLTSAVGIGIYFVSWRVTPNITHQDAEGSFYTPGIKYAFKSKSGGEILNDVLFSRLLAYQTYAEIPANSDTHVIMPRMNSIQIVTEEPALWLDTLVEEWKHLHPEAGVVLTQDERPQN